MNRASKIDFTHLDKFVRGMTEKYAVRVGIFGEKNSRDPGTSHKVPTNAEVGAEHEFGNPARGIPPRSFLRMPLQMMSKHILAETSVGADKLLRDGKMGLVMKRLGIACENAIQGAFESGGFGKWRELAPSTIRRKGSSAILIDTGQLRRAITSKVVDV
jgi:phage gpG-like protein